MSKISLLITSKIILMNFINYIRILYTLKNWFRKKNNLILKLWNDYLYLGYIQEFKLIYFEKNINIFF